MGLLLDFQQAFIARTLRSLNTLKHAKQCGAPDECASCYGERLQEIRNSRRFIRIIAKLNAESPDPEITKSLRAALLPPPSSSDLELHSCHRRSLRAVAYALNMRASFRGIHSLVAEESSIGRAIDKYMSEIDYDWRLARMPSAQWKPTTRIIRKPELARVP